MKPNNITRAIIDATVDRSLREISQDPQRSIRKLADLGRRFSSRSSFLDDVYEIVQDLLRNDDSQYYTAIEHLLRSTDRKGLKNYFINIGYNSLTFGGRIIRETESSESFRIPWCLVLHINPSKPTSINAADIHHFVEQGNLLGIYTFMILLEGPLSKAADLFHIFSENSDSAFTCFLPQGDLDPAQIQLLRSCTNTMILFGSRFSTTEANIRKMQAQKLFYGIYDTYCSETADEWICGNRMDQLSSSHDAGVVILVPHESCGLDTRKQMGKYIRKLRTQPKYPFIPFELTCDVMELNRIISEEACYFELLENGDILTRDDTVVEYRHTLSLKQMLSFALPKQV